MIMLHKKINIDQYVLYVLKLSAARLIIYIYLNAKYVRHAYVDPPEKYVSTSSYACPRTLFARLTNFSFGSPLRRNLRSAGREIGAFLSSLLQWQSKQLRRDERPLQNMAFSCAAFRSDISFFVYWAKCSLND